MFSIVTLTFIAFLSSVARAQSSLTPSQCAGKITSFPNCDAYNNIIKRCSNLDKKASINCFCVQNVVNYAVGCKSEFRQCALDTTFDSDFDSFLLEWHDACDPYLSATITTPPVVQPTATIKVGPCEALIESCNRWSIGNAACKTANSQGPAMTSCMCSRSLVSLASACEVDGGKCQLSSFAVTQLWEYQNCPGASTLFNNAQLTTALGGPSASSTIAGSPRPASTPVETPIFGATTPRGTTISSGSGAHPTARGPSMYLPIVRVVASLQKAIRHLAEARI